MLIAVGQINPIIGDLAYNTKKILDTVAQARVYNADLVVFPELALVGYPPKDLLLRKDFIDRVLKVISDEILPASEGIGIVFGAPLPFKDGLANACLFAVDGQIIARQNKSLLPNYDVFDESRYFIPAEERNIVNFKGAKLGLTICEDVWNDKDYWNRQRYFVDPVQELINEGAELIVNISASPYHFQKQALREDMLKSLANKYRCDFIYANQIGGNDDLIFDGASLFVTKEGLSARGKSFEEDFFVIDTQVSQSILEPPQEDIEWIYKLLVLGIKDYLEKTGFKKAIIGLSGGIDSAVTAALAVAALGTENVTGVAMPSRYSSEGSVADAQSLADNLKINFEIIPIEEMFKAYIKELNTNTSLYEDLAEENIQARIRGNILMFKSNREGAILLSTGNKSEIAVGYTTLYGDMCGGLAVISDLPKTTVYVLAEYINKAGIVIPESTISKPPSAELRPNQVDQDSLPPYETLDAILKAYIEENKSASEIAELGFDEGLVKKILNQVDRNEYKRRQAPPGLKVTSKAFGVGRRMPVAQGWKN